MSTFRISRRIVPVTLSLIVIASAVSCASTAHESARLLVEGNDSALRGDYRGAVDNYEAALKIDPSAAATRRNLGIVLVKVGQYKRARGLLLSVKKSYPFDSELLYFIGESLRGLEDYSAAAANYQEALREDPSDKRVRKALAWTYVKLRRLDNAQEIVEPLMRKNPADLQLRLIMANITNSKSQFKKTLQILTPFEDSGLKVQSEDLVTGQSERALLIAALADAHFGENSIDKAKKLYSEVLRTRPFLTQALIGSAKCELRSNNPRAAMQKLEVATRAAPDSQEAHQLLGKIYESLDPVKSLFYHRRFLSLAKDDPSLQQETTESRKVIKKLEGKPVKK